MKNPSQNVLFTLRVKNSSNVLFTLRVKNPHAERGSTIRNANDTIVPARPKAARAAPGEFATLPTSASHSSGSRLPHTIVASGGHDDLERFEVVPRSADCGPRSDCRPCGDGAAGAVGSKSGRASAAFPCRRGASRGLDGPRCSRATRLEHVASDARRGRGGRGPRSSGPGFDAPSSRGLPDRHWRMAASRPSPTRRERRGSLRASGLFRVPRRLHRRAAWDREEGVRGLAGRLAMRHRGASRSGGRQSRSNRAGKIRLVGRGHGEALFDRRQSRLPAAKPDERHAEIEQRERMIGPIGKLKLHEPQIALDICVAGSPDLRSPNARSGYRSARFRRQAE